MPTYKMTFFFEGFQTTKGVGGGSAVGWTETWYLTTTGGIDDALFDPAVTTYIDQRRSFLPDQYFVAWVRASQTDKTRNTKVREVRGGIGQGPGAAAQVTCAVLADFTALPLQAGDHAHHRRFLIRGLSSNVIDGNVIHPNAVEWRRIELFLDYLATGRIEGAPNPVPNPNRWQIRFLPGTVPFSGITLLKLEPGAPNYITVTAPNITQEEGTQWIIKGVRHPYYCNRTWTTIRPSLTGTTTIQLGRSRRVISGDWDFSGQIAKVAYEYAAPSQMIVIGLRERDTGRPSRLTRGRRNPVV